jgi:hypothetical protein
VGSLRSQLACVPGSSLFRSPMANQMHALRTAQVVKPRTLAQPCDAARKTHPMCANMLMRTMEITTLYRPDGSIGWSCEQSAG